MEDAEIFMKKVWLDLVLGWWVTLDKHRGGTGRWERKIWIEEGALKKKTKRNGDFTGSPGLRLRTPNAGSTDLISGQGTKILPATRWDRKKKKKEWSTDACYNVDEPGKPYTKWKKPDKTITYCMILLDEIPRIGKPIERTQMIARDVGR